MKIEKLPTEHFTEEIPLFWNKINELIEAVNSLTDPAERKHFRGDDCMGHNPEQLEPDEKCKGHTTKLGRKLYAEGECYYCKTGASIDEETEPAEKKCCELCSAKKGWMKGQCFNFNCPCHQEKKEMIRVYTCLPTDEITGSVFKNQGVFKKDKLLKALNSL
jgi:hypothetical protein